MSKFLEQINVPTEINENEKHLIHAVIVEGQFNPNTLETTFKAKKQCYNDRSWTVVKNRLKRLGYTHVYLIHDPAVESKETGEGGDAGSEEPKGVDRTELIEKAISLGWTGKKNEKNQIYLDFIAEKQAEGKATDNAETTGEAVKTEKKVLTELDLEMNPDLAKEGLKVGDEIEIPVED